MVEREFKRLRIDKEILSAITPASSGVICRYLLRIFLISVVLFPNTIQAQWKQLANFGATIIYFIDLPGPPRIGFATASGFSGFFKTTDGGETWRKIALPVDLDTNTVFTDIIFKDSLVGWMSVTGSPRSIGSDGGCVKTTDGGETWSSILNGSQSLGCSLYYDKKSDGLFLSVGAGSGEWNLISWDEGNTWVNGTEAFDLGYGGFAFSSDDLGIQATSDIWLPPWYRTTDGGKTWNSIMVDTNCWQPLAIQGTQTYFANTYDGAIYRTDDSWNTYQVIYQFPPAPPDVYGFSHQSSCIRGSLSSLIVQIGPGCYQSTDEGISWRFLCGPAWTGPSVGSNDQLGYLRFYVKGNFIYCSSEGADTVASEEISSLWMLNLDSLNIVSSNYAEKFPNGLQQSTIAAGDTVQVNYLSTAALGAEVGVDSVSLTLSFDTSSLSLSHFVLPPGWRILDSSSSGGNYHLLLASSDSLALDSSALLLSADFTSYLSTTTQSKVYLDSVHLYGHRLNCDCEVQSVLAVDTSTHATAIDSVEVDFTGCGDSTLLAFMQGQPLFSIVSIQPNPAQNEITVQLSGSVQPEIEMYDALGRSVLAPLTTPQPPPIPLRSIGGGVIVDVTNVPSGIYFIRVSAGGYVVSRSVVVEH